MLILRMRMGQRIKDNFNRYSISGPTFVASGILFREQVFVPFFFFFFSSFSFSFLECFGILQHTVKVYIHARIT